MRDRPCWSTTTRGLPSSSGPKALPKLGGALIAQIVLAAIGRRYTTCRVPAGRREAGGGQFLGDDGSAGAGADNHGVYFRKRHLRIPPVIVQAAANRYGGDRRASANWQNRGCRRGEGCHRSPAGRGPATSRKPASRRPRPRSPSLPPRVPVWPAAPSARRKTSSTNGLPACRSRAARAVRYAPCRSLYLRVSWVSI